MLTLNTTGAVGLLEYSSIGFIALLVIRRLWRSWWRNRSVRWTNALNRAKKAKGKTSDGMARYWPVTFSFLYISLLVAAWYEQPKYPIALEHHVVVYGMLPDGDWHMASDEEGQFAYRCCPDFDCKPMLQQAIGYVADHARWEQRPDCRSIRATGLGFFWRDENFNYRRVSDAGTAR